MTVWLSSEKEFSISIPLSKAKKLVKILNSNKEFKSIANKIQKLEKEING